MEGQAEEKREGQVGGVSLSDAPQEVLIVVSKLKDYIQKRGQMNTSGTVATVLSDFVRRACDSAIECAAADGRKTVMDRDFKIQ